MLKGKVVLNHELAHDVKNVLNCALALCPENKYEAFKEVEQRFMQAVEEGK